MQNIIFLLSCCKDWGDITMNSSTLSRIRQNMQDLTLVLANRNYDKLGILNNVDINTLTFNHSTSGYEISFEIYKTLNNMEENLWYQIIDLKLLWVKELDVYFEIYVSMDDSFSVKKSITGTSLCEAELSQICLFDTEINTEKDIAGENYKVTTFYNSDPKASLLNRIFSKIPNYTIKHVDSSLADIQRSFSINNKSIYDFLMSDCSEQFHCTFVFDSRDRSVSAYDLYVVCMNESCGHRDDMAGFTHVDASGNVIYSCPKCGSTDVKYYGEDTGIFVDRENLTDSVKFTTDIDSVKNCLKLIAGDDVITAAARLLNMNGTDYIYHITEEQKEDMPKLLTEKINQYDSLYASYQKEYEQLIHNIYNYSEKIYYYRSSMMPAKIQAPVTSGSEAAKLTENNLSPLGLSSVSASAGRATIESALKNYAKVYIKTGYVKLEINNSSYTYKGTDASGNHYGLWTGNFKVTNYSDTQDVTYSNIITVKVYDDYEAFINQKVKKVIADNDEDGSVFDILNITNQNSFKNALTSYGLNRLKSFYDAIQSAMDCLVQLNQAAQDARLYESVYLPFYNKLQACQNEIDQRQATVDEWQKKYDNTVLRQQTIQKILNFENYIGKDLYQLFCCYRREDTYQNDNYISDGLKDQEIISRAKDFLETAQKELIRSATRQHSISSALCDLLLIPEFQPLLDKFEVGNWLRIRADGNIYKLRLIRYEISFSDINTIHVQFSDITKIRDAVTDTASILQSADAMSSGYSYICKQADAGQNANSNINSWVENGLNSALIHIKNNDHEEITYDKHGFLAREFDDITGSYGKEQLRITHNILGFTEDNWKTVSLGLGKHEYTYYNGNAFVTAEGYGISARFCKSSFIYGSQIIGGDIYSENYAPLAGTHLNLNNGTFSFAGGGLTYDGKTLSGQNLVIRASTITGTTMNSSVINSTTMNAGTINSSNIYGTYISGGTIEGNSIHGNTIDGNTLSANTISGGTITGTNVYSSNLYSGYISGGTIEGSHIRGGRMEGSVFETTTTSGGLAGTLQIKDGILTGYYGNGNKAYQLSPFHIDLGDSSIIVNGFHHFVKSINMMGGAFTVIKDRQTSNCEINLNENVYIKKDLYINGMKWDDINKTINDAYTKAVNAATKSSLDSLKSRVSSLESAMHESGGQGSTDF